MRWDMGGVDKKPPLHTSFAAAVAALNARLVLLVLLFPIQLLWGFPVHCIRCGHARCVDGRGGPFAAFGDGGML